jgi:Domain of unknown function (DUF6456)
MMNEKGLAAKKRTSPKKPKRLQRRTRRVTELDPNGIEVTHHRTVDTLGLMVTSGAITSAMQIAGRDFQAAFTIACFHSMRSVNLTSIVRPSSGHDVWDLTDNQMAARERVARALEALGGHGSPAGSCVWHVIGMQTSMREWALRQGWGGRPVRQESAQGILVAALGVLVKHYGIRDGGRRSA